MPRNYLKWGDWNAICDVCGFKHKASEMTERWDGLMVGKECWEPRHPQDFLRTRLDDPSVPWARPDGDDPQVGPVCFLWDQYAYAGIGAAGCMQAGKNSPFTSIQVWELKFPSSPA